MVWFWTRGTAEMRLETSHDNGTGEFVVILATDGGKVTERFAGRGRLILTPSLSPRIWNGAATAVKDAQPISGRLHRRHSTPTSSLSNIPRSADMIMRETCDRRMHALPRAVQVLGD
jgi:hypothetical protein